MRDRWLNHAMSGLLVLGMLAGPALAAEDDPHAAFYTAFREHVAASADLDDRARELILDSIDQRDPDTGADVLIEALVLLSPEFREGMDAYDGDDYEASLKAFEASIGDDDPYVSANAATYAVRSQVQLNMLVQARDRIGELLAGDQVAKHTLDAGEMLYLLGYAQVQTLEFDEGRRTLERFLDEHPDAAQRFVVTARQMLAEIDRRVPESIGEVADLMTFSEQRLALADTTQPVHDSQDRIIELLDKLIEQAQQQEQQAQSSASQSQSQRNRQQQQQQPQNQPNSPMQDSQLDQRRAQRGAHPGRVVTPGEAWGSMPDAEREKILQVLRDSFPGRYRALVEQYYKTLAEQP